MLLSVAAYFSGLNQYLSFDYMKYQRRYLAALVQEYPLLSPLIFVSIFIFIVATSIPGGTALSLIAGFLFPQPFATIYAVIGAATGACIIFYISSMSVGASLRSKVHQYGGARIERGLRENEVIYIMLLRLVPIFPFWFINIGM